MKNKTEAEKKAWQAGTQHKELIISILDETNKTVLTLNNSEIVSESLEISQILESNNTLSFGDVNAATVKFQCRDIKADVRGLKISIEMKLSGTDYDPELLFYGIIDGQENQTHEDILTTITACDFMRYAFNLVMTDWWKTHTFSGTKFRNYIEDITGAIALTVKCAGMTEEDLLKFANLDCDLAQKPDLVADYGNVSGEMLLKWIAQAGNVYLTMDGNRIKAVRLQPMSEGLHPHIGLHPRKGLYPSGGAYDKRYTQGDYIKAKYEPYKTEKIDKVIITDKAGIGQGQYPTDPGENVFYIDGNPFLWSMPMQVCAQNIFERIKDVFFTPSAIETIGMPFVELGDVIKVYTAGNIIYSYVLRREFLGIQNIRDKYINDAGQYQDTHAPSFASVTNDNGKTILKIQADIVEMNEVIAKKITADDVKTINLSADQITAGTLDCTKITVKDLVVTNSMISGMISAGHIDTNFASATTFKVPYTGFYMGAYAVTPASLSSLGPNSLVLSAYPE